jgi:hypothetical protein
METQVPPVIIPGKRTITLQSGQLYQQLTHHVICLICLVKTG